MALCFLLLESTRAQQGAELLPPPPPCSNKILWVSTLLPSFLVAEGPSDELTYSLSLNQAMKVKVTHLLRNCLQSKRLAELPP